MTITAKILADSIAKNNRRITTFVLEYPRFIHSELMTHRVFSRNSASSRAIPIERFIQKVNDDPAMVVHWSKNQKGMTQSSEVGEQEKIAAKMEWLRARDNAVASAKYLSGLGVHKAVANRLLEPFIHMKVVLTTTELDNFFELRCHEDAQPEIRVLADAMLDAVRSSVPVVKTQDASDWSGWHLPFVTEEELADTSEQNCFRNLVRSTARCARVSYDRVDGGSSDFENDLRIFKQLGESKPLHLSPFEHSAFPAIDTNSYFNLVGWQSLRWHLEQNPKWFKMIMEKSK